MERETLLRSHAEAPTWFRVKLSLGIAGHAEKIFLLALVQFSVPAPPGTGEEEEKCELYKIHVAPT